MITTKSVKINKKMKSSEKNKIIIIIRKSKVNKILWEIIYLWYNNKV